ncbi:MAG: tRNA/rRNA methyltransferase, partial [Candidatus Woesebacteria bacterium GW2011_GWE2_31_6]
MKLKLNSKQLRKTKPVNGEDKKIKRNPIYVVLDNIIDTYNIGSIFRLADAVAIEKVFICGDSDYPPSSRIHKAAVGTEEWVPWKKTETTVEVINKLKLEGIQTIAVEQ